MEVKYKFKIALPMYGCVYEEEVEIDTVYGTSDEELEQLVEYEYDDWVRYVCKCAWEKIEK